MRWEGPRKEIQIDEFSFFSSMQGCRNLKGAPNYKRLPLDAKCSWPQQGKTSCNIISWLLTFPFTRIVLAPAIQENKNRIYMGFPWFATWASIWIIWNQSTVCYCQHWPSLQLVVLLYSRQKNRLLKLRVSISTSSLSRYLRCLQRHLWAGKFES